LGTPSYIVTRR